MVERILGGSWLPAIRIAVPVLLITGGLSALTAATQLWAQMGSVRLPFLQFVPNNVGAYFHSVAQQMAQALGSPLFYDDPSGSLRQMPLLVTVVLVVSFAALLRQEVAGLPLAERVMVTVRAYVLTLLLLLLPTFAAGITFQESGETGHVTVSPGRVLGWGLLFLALAALVAAAEPLRLLAARVPRLDLLAMRATVRAAWVSIISALLLGFVAVLVTGLVEGSASATDNVRFLPLGLGHAVDLGVNGWHVGMLGKVRVPDSTGIALYERHGLSPAYFALLAIPIVSALLGVLSLRRYRGRLSGRVLARCAYRMALPVTLVYWLLALGTTHAFDEDHLGPQVLLGTLYAAGWYFLLGFAFGQLLLRGLPEPLPAATDPGTGSTGAVVPPPAPRLLPMLPVVLAALGAALLIGFGVTAAVTEGGKHSPSVFAFGLEADDDSVSDDDDTASSQDAQARQALRDLAAAEESYHDVYDRYTSSKGDLFSFSEPSDVYVTIEEATSFSFCATASGLDSDNYFTIRESATVEDGDNC